MSPIFSGLPEGERLNGAFRSDAGAKEGFAAARGEISLGAGAGMIGVRVRDDSAIYRRRGIDIEITRGAVQTGITRFEQGHGNSALYTNL